MSISAGSLSWLIPGAYLLGSLPFSVWLGKLFLKKDIRSYGDHNPGATNVFIAGNITIGMTAILLDIGKGIPLILIARHMGLGQIDVVIIGLAAILGHDFSPWLKFHGGKGVAITYGVLIAMWYPEWLFPFCATAIIGLIIWKSNAWVMLLTPIETILFMLFIHTELIGIIFMLCVQILFTFKYASNVTGPPRLRPTLQKLLLPRRNV
jgi:glycerol-3-phosphate acyltransferase PlsY